jgi:rhodanese-related sulfurtransferase
MNLLETEPGAFDLGICIGSTHAFGSGDAAYPNTIGRLRQIVRPGGYAREHIPGAINIPHRMMNPASTNQLSKDVLIVTYCDGIGCNGSTKGALNMLDLGFRVKELLGGLDWWKRDGHKTSVTVADEAPAACGCA